MTLLDQIRTLVATERDPVKINDAIEAIVGPGDGNILERRHGSLVIQIGGRNLAALAEDLGWMRSLEIAAAPELVALFEGAFGHLCVSRYWAAPDDRFVSVDATAVSIRPEARQRFRRDMATLAEHGKMHPYAGRGYANWYVGEPSGTLVLSTWTVLAACEPDERDAWLATIDKRLARRIEAT